MNVAIIGASNDRRKFGNKALRAYRHQGHTVFPVNVNASAVEGLPTFRSIVDIPEAIDVVLVYVPPEVTITLLEEIAQKNPRELYLNPGSEDAAAITRAREIGLDPILACSIIAIGESPSSYS